MVPAEMPVQLFNRLLVFVWRQLFYVCFPPRHWWVQLVSVPHQRPMSQRTGFLRLSVPAWLLRRWFPMLSAGRSVIRPVQPLVTAREEQEEVESNINAVCWSWGFSYVAWFRLERLNWINLMEVWRNSQWLGALLKWCYLQDRRFVQRASVNSTETVCKAAWNRAATHLWGRSSPSVTLTAATGPSRWVLVQSLDLPEDLSPVMGHWEVLLCVFQCHGSTGHCWCVDSRGQERAGTRTPPGTAPSDCDRQGDI